MRKQQNFQWKELNLGTCYYPEHWDPRSVEGRPAADEGQRYFYPSGLRNLPGIRLSPTRESLPLNFLISFWMWRKKSR